VGCSQRQALVLGYWRRCPYSAAEGAQPDLVGTAPVAGLHPRFGADASSEVTVTWHTLQQVRNPRVVLGHPDGKSEQAVDATPVGYINGKTHRVVCTYHATARHLSRRQG
jgi:hypothetical protein